jgi:hypothetical protein
VAELFIALVHYPIVDRNGRVITSAITSLDLHDLARTARTYGARGFFVVHPISEQREFAARVIGHWFESPGREFDSRRKEALDLTRIVSALEDAVAEVESQTGARPLVVATSARRVGTTSYNDIRERLNRQGGAPVMVIFGTGFGLAPAILESADLTLEPVHGPGDYNHLSVRAAAAIVLDRLRGR